MPAENVFYEVAVERLNEQMDRVDKLDAKVAAVFSFSAAVLPIFGALLALFQSNPPKLSIVFYFAAISVYLLLLAAATRAYMISGWRLDPDLDRLRQNSLQYDEPTVRLWVADECTRSIAVNERQLLTKARYVGVSIALLAGGALLLSLGAT